MVMGKKKKKSRKKLIELAQSHQRQYNIHQEKIKKNPESLSISHWKKEKANFLSRINYYLTEARVDKS
jgi:predicted patatin/cPLA2 family phospholipase